jgi:hypothetical protein
MCASDSGSQLNGQWSTTPVFMHPPALLTDSDEALSGWQTGLITPLKYNKNNYLAGIEVDGGLPQRPLYGRQRQVGPFGEFYASLLDKGMKKMARLTLARKIAAITLTLWKKEERFDAQQLKTQAA